MTLLKHLHSRYLDTSLHRVWVDEQEHKATFPLYNLSGSFVGLQVYNPHGDKKVNNNPKEGKYFTRSFKDNSILFWGLESWYSSNTLFLLEGLFDAARVTSHGYSAVACFSNNLGKPAKSCISFIKQIRPVVAICDNDDAGKKLAKYGHCSVTVLDGKDLSESSDNYVKDLLSYYEQKAFRDYR